MSQFPPMTPGSGMVRPHRGVLILVFGILGLVICVIFGIAAWVMGNSDLAAMRAGEMDRSGEGLTNAGRICGIVACCLAILAIVIWILLIALGVGAAAVSGN